MNIQWRAFSIALLTTTLLAGCAGAVVGGATTGAAMATDRRTAGAFVDDELIEWKALGALRGDREMSPGSHFNVTSFDGIVLISGETPTEEFRTRAANYVRNIEKVRKVHNELTLAAPSSMMSRSSDTAITAKVKTRLMGINNLGGFDATKVKVVTENGTVFLMGKVLHNEADAVTNTARTVAGVQRIVRLFEYLD